MNHQSIELTETTEEETLKRLSDIVYNKLRECYGEITPELTEHIINEFVYTCSFELRQGNPLLLEAIGQFLPARMGGVRVVTYRPDPGLFTPLPGKAVNGITLADRRAR